MNCQRLQPAELLNRAIPYFNSNAHILDLACGSGRNGCYLSDLGYQLTYLDRQKDVLELIQRNHPNSHFINADLETHPSYELPIKVFDALLVFRYLHRPLMPHIANALKPGGIIVYETFNHQQASIGRPRNPDFLLNDGELMASFSDFDVLYQFEGYDESQQAFISQFIGRKPTVSST